eukprot:9504183-Pyramimonas_sp.AAC.2
MSSLEEREDDGPRLILFRGRIRGRPVTVMVDSGASASFISTAAVARLDLKRIPTSRPYRVRVADGHVHTSAEFVRVSRFTAEATRGTYTESLDFKIMPMDIQADVILGGDWLRRCTPVTLDYSGFGSVRFTRNNRAVVIQGGSPGTAESGAPRARPSARSKVAHFNLVQSEFCTSAVAAREQKRLRYRYGERDHSESSEHDGLDDEIPQTYLAFAVPDVGGMSLSRIEAGSETSGSSDTARRDDIDADIPDDLRASLQSLTEEFRDVLVTELPPDTALQRSYKAGIRLRDDWSGSPPFRRSYRLSARELAALKEQLDELMEKGYVRASSSPFGAPVLMVPKPHKPDKLRLVIDYRSLNSITQRDRYPLPDVQQLLDDLQGATVFSTMDALWGFWQIPMEEQDIPKTAMCTPFGSYEWLVMPMGLTNSPSTWQRMMQSYLGDLPFCRVFVDDILIFSRSFEEHLDHIRQVLQRCREKKVALSVEKCCFFKRACRFLGHVITSEGCHPQHDKVQAVRDWPEPTSQTEIR